MRDSKIYITAIYDNGGKSFDRYTVYLNIHASWNVSGFMQCFSMSENPQHPQGYGQHGSGYLGRHNGKRIKYSELPAQCQDTLKQLEYREAK